MPGCGAENHSVKLREGLQQRTGAALFIAAIQRVTEYHVTGRGREPFGQAARELQLALGRGVRQAARALQFQRQKRIGAWTGRPAFIIQTHDPETVEVEAAGFQQAEHLHRRGRVCGWNTRSPAMRRKVASASA